MILEFRVKNFLSFSDEQVLSFEASDNNYLEDYHCIDIKPGVRILKTAMIYGANASGKTNLLKALDFLHKAVLYPRRKREKTGFTPFKFNEKLAKQPGRFEISFFIEETKYVYSLITDDKTIYEEKLIYYPMSQPALIFFRKYNSNKNNFSLEVGSKIKLKSYEIHVLKANTTNVSTIVSSHTKTNINFMELAKVFVWFENFHNIIYPNNLYELAKTSFKITEYKDFLISNLQEADFNISNISIIKNYSEPPDIHFYYTVISETGDEQIVILKEKQALHNDIYEGEESLGTKQYIMLLLELKQCLSENIKIGIDELESSLHPKLVYHFIKAFLNYSKQTNSQMQLIFTTHNADLLNEDFIRKDIIWFAEKQKNRSSKLYPLSKFETQKNITFSKEYKKGKFGAIPKL